MEVINNITLGLIKYITADLNEQLGGVNIAQIRLERLELDGREIIRVNSVEGLVKEYDVQEIIVGQPLVEPSAHNKVVSNLRDALFNIIQKKNDGAIDFVSQEDFQELVKVFQETNPVRAQEAC